MALGGGVEVELIGLAVDGEAATGDAIGVAPGDGAEMPAEARIARQAVETQHHIVDPAAAVRHLEPGDDAAEGEDVDAHASIIGKAIDVDLAGRLRWCRNGPSSSDFLKRSTPAWRPSTRAFAVVVTPPGRTTYWILGIRVNQGAIWAR